MPSASPLLAAERTHKPGAVGPAAESGMSWRLARVFGFPAANVPVADLPAAADKVIAECGRLPLALSVVGAMLRGTDHAIAEIALMVGFSDQTALTRCFRRFRATTPNALRQRSTTVSAELRPSP